MSKKDYKKGLADAMEAYVDFGRKQEKAINHIEKEVGRVGEKVNKLGEQIGMMADYITDKEKAELYNLHMVVDIKELDELTKYLLVAVLYELSKKGTSEEQQNYVRAIQNYLEIKNVQTSINLGVVENIEDTISSKAVMQSVLEFLYIRTCTWEMSDEEEEFLDLFNLNMKNRKEIMKHIEAIVSVVGTKGLSEKYGFVPEEIVEESEEKESFCNYEISEEIAAEIKGNDYVDLGKYVVYQLKDRYYCSLYSGSTIVIWDRDKNIRNERVILPYGEDEMEIFECGSNLLVNIETLCALYNIEKNESRLIASSKEGRITDCVGNDRYIVWFSDNVYLYNIETNESKMILDGQGKNRYDGYLKGIARCMVDNKLYFYGYEWVTSSRNEGIYCYDLETKEIKFLFGIEEVGQINIFSYKNHIYFLVIERDSTSVDNHKIELYSIPTNPEENQTTPKIHFSSVASWYNMKRIIQHTPNIIFMQVKKNREMPLYLYNLDTQKLVQISSDITDKYNNLLGEFYVAGNYFYMRRDRYKPFERINIKDLL